MRGGHCGVHGHGAHVHTQVFVETSSRSYIGSRGPEDLCMSFAVCGWQVWCGSCTCVFATYDNALLIIKSINLIDRNVERKLVNTFFDRF